HGLSWSEPSFGSLPAFTSVDGGLTLLNLGRKDYLLATRPVDVNSRKDLSVSLSDDGGLSWLYTKAIFKGPADYSDIITLSDKSIFVLYGRGNPRNVATARIDVTWIKENKK